MVQTRGIRTVAGGQIWLTKTFCQLFKNIHIYETEMLSNMQMELIWTNSKFSIENEI